LTVVATATDVRKGVIPNWLTFGGMAIGLISNVALGYSTGGRAGAIRSAAMSGLGLVLCGLVPAFLFYRKRLGGGDVKLFAAIGAVLGPSFGMDAELYAMLLAAFVFAPLRSAWRGQLGVFLRDVGRQIANTFRAKDKRLPLSGTAVEPMRLGPSILAGTALAVALRALP
jgi:prepilin peptidase CpaA